jgi:hypothetical protein
MVRLYCIPVAVLLSLGCGESRPVVSPAPIQRNSPAGQFDWVMLRLERAVLNFQPSPQVGLLIGKRKVSYELFPPDATRSHHAARVTIESEMVYILDQPNRASDKEKKRQERLKRRRTQQKLGRQTELNDPLGESYDDPLANKFMDQMEEIAADHHGPIMPDAIIDNPQSSNRTVYDLAFLDERWQLQTKPETVHEQLWFDYALGINALKDSN